MKASVLQPGLLVSLKTSVKGGVSYQRIEVEPEHIDETGARKARWETARVIPDPQEFENAGIARGKARALVSGVCCNSAFGLLCPSIKEDELQAAITEARRITEAHNETAALTRVEVFVLVGRIAQDDAEAARAIGAEVRELLEAMQAGIKAADPEAIREAANKARAIGGMLSEGVAGKVDKAIEEARSAAREIVRKVEKQGFRAADVVAVCSVKAIEAARFAFLDVDAGEVKSEAPTGRALELPDEDAPAVSAAPTVALPLELI